MRKDLTELVFILDRSGSMSGLEQDTIGGFNSMLRKQKKAEGDVIVTTVLFDNNYQTLHDRININGVRPMTNEEYYVEGSTALLDAIGKTINKLVNVQKNTRVNQRAEKVMFVIITDGMENASRRYSSQDIKQLIERQKEEYSWEFLFLGANIDAVETAYNIGIKKDRAVTYHADDIGTKKSYEAVNKAILEKRCCNNINENWSEKLEEDFNKRKKNNK